MDSLVTVVDGLSLVVGRERWRRMKDVGEVGGRGCWEGRGGTCGLVMERVGRMDRRVRVRCWCAGW